MRSPMAGRFSSSFTNIGSASSWFEVYASFSTFMMLLRTAINDLIPLKLRNFIISKLKRFFTDYQPNNQVSLQIDQFWDGSTNHLYYAAKEYIPTKISNTYKSLKVGKISKHNNIVLAFDGKQVVEDEFDDIKLKWRLVENSNNDDGFDNPKKEYKEYKHRSKDYEENGFVLSFDEKHRDKVMEKYIPHVLSTYDAIKAGNKTLKIHSMQSGPWKQSDLTHPASFDSLAMDPDLKNSIIDDLDRFLRRKKLYKKVGKPWKRGYLLYGPPGTGKSSLIAAMAKYLKFDVYDLDLSSVFSNSELMRAMRETSNRSIIVFEDIDCNSEVLDRAKPDKFPDMDFLDGIKMSSSRKLEFDASTSNVDSTKSDAAKDVVADKSKIVMVDNYREPVEVPPFLNVKRNSWEIIVNESHIQPNHKLRLPQHLTYEGVLSNDKNIMLTQLDRDQDAVDAFGCEVVAEEGDPYKRYISSGWHAFVKASQLEVGDRLLFSVENYDKNIFVRFVYESDIDSEYDNWSD